jgi:hypothetical protein
LRQQKLMDNNPQPKLLPPDNFFQRKLPVTKCHQTWYRLNPSRHNSALFFDRTGSGRFDNFDLDYGILYVGETEKVTFIECFGRDPHLQIVSEADVTSRNLFAISSDRPLKLLHLWGDGLYKIGAKAIVSSTDNYSLSRAWGKAIFNHPQSVDGIRYFSSHDNSLICCGFFDARVKPFLREENLGNLVDNHPKTLGQILQDYNCALIDDFHW